MVDGFPQRVSDNLYAAKILLAFGYHGDFTVVQTVFDDFFVITRLFAGNPVPLKVDAGIHSLEHFFRRHIQYRSQTLRCPDDIFALHPVFFRKRDRKGYFVRHEKLAVPIVNLSPQRGNGDFLCGAGQRFLTVLVPPDDLNV